MGEVFNTVDDDDGIGRREFINRNRFSSIFESSSMLNPNDSISTQCTCSLITFNYKVHNLNSIGSKSKILPPGKSAQTSASKKPKISLSKSTSSILGLLPHSANQGWGNGPSQKQYPLSPKDASHYNSPSQSSLNIYDPSHQSQCSKSGSLKRGKLGSVFNMDPKEYMRLDGAKNTSTFLLENSTIFPPPRNHRKENSQYMFDMVSFSIHDRNICDSDLKKRDENRETRQTWEKTEETLHKTDGGTLHEHLHEAKRDEKGRKNVKTSKMQSVGDSRMLEYNIFSKNLTNDEARTFKELDCKYAQSSEWASQNRLSVTNIEGQRLIGKELTLTKTAPISLHAPHY